ncbi:MAG: hypothetical protein WBO08_09705 [Mycobacterium sp.]|nr:hypothetical protein [Mycobacterium sp.]
MFDYARREYLWGPHSYDSLTDASRQLPHGQFSIYLISSSDTWFQLVAIAFAIFGGRWLTLLHGNDLVDLSAQSRPPRRR